MKHEYILAFPASCSRCIAVLPWPASKIVSVKVPMRGTICNSFGFETRPDGEGRLIFFADTSASWPGVSCAVEVEVEGEECQRCGHKMPVDHPFSMLCNLCLVETKKSEPTPGGGFP